MTRSVATSSYPLGAESLYIFLPGVLDAAGCHLQGRTKFLFLAPRRGAVLMTVLYREGSAG
jgi:hypothetical protein